MTTERASATPRRQGHDTPLSFRLPKEDRLELYRLAIRRKQPVSEVLRDLIAQATMKKEPVKGAQSAQ